MSNAKDALLERILARLDAAARAGALAELSAREAFQVAQWLRVLRAKWPRLAPTHISVSRPEGGRP